jgi:hypothetical protein
MQCKKMTPTPGGKRGKSAKQKGNGGRAKGEQEGTSEEMKGWSGAEAAVKAACDWPVSQQVHNS